MVPTFCKPPVFIVTVRRLLPFVSSLADDHAIIPYLLISQGPKAQLYKDKFEGFNFITPSCSELQWTALHCPTCRTMLLHLLRRKIVCAAKSLMQNTDVRIDSGVCRPCDHRHFESQFRRRLRCARNRNKGGSPEPRVLLCRESWIFTNSSETILSYHVDR
jgi:hypothetical protein